MRFDCGEAAQISSKVSLFGRQWTEFVAVNLQTPPISAEVSEKDEVRIEAASHTRIGRIGKAAAG